MSSALLKGLCNCVTFSSIILNLIFLIRNRLLIHFVPISKMVFVELKSMVQKHQHEKLTKEAILDVPKDRK